MKFVRRSFDLERNDIGLGLLLEFLEGDAYRSVPDYIDWLKNSRKSGSIGGNLSILEREGELITIRDGCCLHDDDDSPTEEKERDKYVTNRQRLIQILHQWEEFVAERDKLSSLALSTKDLLITQDKEGVFSVGFINKEDPRFSRCIVDSNPKYARVEKSKIFDDYLKVISNDRALYVLGSILTEYYKDKFQSISSWMEKYKLQDDEVRAPFSVSNLSKDRQGIFLINGYNIEKGITDNLIFFKSEELKSLFNEWLEIIHMNPFPKAILITKENGKIVLSLED
jgi:hypothetical protein